MDEEPAAAKAKSSIIYFTDISRLSPLISKENQWTCPLSTPISELFLEFVVKRMEPEVTQMINLSPHLLEGTDPSWNIPLHVAAQTCGEKVIELMISKYRKGLQIRNSSGNTPLHIAVRFGRNEIVALLLERFPPAVDVENNLGHTPVSMAINPMHGIIDEVLWKLLKASKAHQNQYEKGTLLHRLLYYMRDDLAARLIAECDVTHLEAANKDGDTVLHHALRYRSEELSIALRIIERSGNVAAQNKDGDTPLHMAVCLRDFTIVPKLLDKMTDANLTNKKGELALHFAVLRPDLPHAIRVLQKTNLILRPDYTGNTPMHFLFERLQGNSIASGSFCSLYHKLALKMLQKVIENEELIEVTKSGKCCGSLLNLALHCSSHLYAEMMLPQTQQVEEMGNKGSTAVHLALERHGENRKHKGFASVCKMVFSKLQNDCAKDMWGNTPLHVAVRYNMSEYVGIIFSKGRNCANVANSQLQTPLHIAAYFCADEAVWRPVLENSEDVNVADMFESTALHYAVRHCCLELAEALLEKGGDVDLKDREGHSPLQLAVLHSNKLLPRMLQSTKNINELNKRGAGLLHMAIERL